MKPKLQNREWCVMSWLEPTAYKKFVQHENWIQLLKPIIWMLVNSLFVCEEIGLNLLYLGLLGNWVDNLYQCAWSACSSNISEDVLSLCGERTAPPCAMLAPPCPLLTPPRTWRGSQDLHGDREEELRPSWTVVRLERLIHRCRRCELMSHGGRRCWKLRSREGCRWCRLRMREGSHHSRSSKLVVRP
jgi:hypothetical protein